jgi:hypothetical protein
LESKEGEVEEEEEEEDDSNAEEECAMGPVIEE